jgi:hypothetical protein
VLDVVWKLAVSRLAEEEAPILVRCGRLHTSLCLPDRASEVPAAADVSTFVEGGIRS